MQQQDLAFLDELVAHDQPPTWNAVDDDIFIDEGVRAQATGNAGTAVFFQPFAGAVILRNGCRWHGGFYADGRYYGSIGAAERAQRIAIERAHVDALHEDVARRQLRTLANWYLEAHPDVPSRRLVGTEIIRAARQVLGRSPDSGEQQLLAETLKPLIGESARYQLTHAGRQALAASTEPSAAHAVDARKVG